MQESLFKLEIGEHLDPKRVLAAAWREISLRRLSSGERWHIEADTAEYMIYIRSGSGTVSTAEGSFNAHDGCAYTVVKGDSITLEAGSGPLELFLAVIEV